jgi:RimJ/RimL family protein N-acetyltransferase
VRLRAASDGDVRDTLENGRHPEIERMYGVSTANLPPMTHDQAEAWVARVAAQPHSWVVEFGGRCVGAARLHSLEQHDARASYAIGLQVPALLGMGLGTEVTRLVLAYAFGAIGLHRVGLRVLATNERAIRCYSACGFVEEGRERESARVDGAWQDDILMGILDRDFDA